MRRRLAIALAATVLGGCNPPKSEASSPSPAPPSTVAKPLVVRSSFFVVAEGLDASDEDPSGLRLCNVDNATVLCHPPLVYRKGRFVDVGLGNVHDITGTWPDDIWALRVPKCVDSSQDTPGCPLGLDVVHWSEGRWTKRGFVRLEMRRYTPTALDAWPGGRAVVVRQIRDKSGEFYSAVQFFGPPPHPTLPKLANISTARHVDAVWRINDTETLVQLTTPVGNSELRTDVERWIDGKLSASTIQPDGDGPMVVNSWFDILQFGTPRGPLHFDGKGWSKFELPPAGKVGHDYAREPDGTQWVILGAGSKNQYGEPSDGVLYSKRPGSTWEPMTLPSPAFAPEGEEQIIKPTHVIVKGPGDIWVRGWYHAESVRGVLLNTRKPQSICFLTFKDRSCRDAPKH